MQGRKDGYQQVINQYRYITSLNRPNVHYVPADVCPGPQEIFISDKITLVVIDSQWWLHRFEKPTVRSGCECNTEAELLSTLIGDCKQKRRQAAHLCGASSIHYIRQARRIL